MPGSGFGELMGLQWEKGKTNEDLRFGALFAALAPHFLLQKEIFMSFAVGQ